MTKRVIDTEFWNDDKIVELFSPEDKLFFLYLMTNPHTTQLGIYHINKKQMAFEIGYSVEAVSVLIDRFETKYDLIKYSKGTSEVAIKNYLRHSIVKGGKPVEDLLMKEIDKVKDRTLLQYVYDNLINIENLNASVEAILLLLNVNDNDNENVNVNDVSYHDSYNDSYNDSYHDSSNDSYNDSYHDSSNDSSKASKKTIFSVIKESSESEEVKHSLEEFVSMRKEIHHPMTVRGIELAIKKLNKLAFTDEDKIAIINQSIERSYQGLFALDVSRKNGNAGGRRFG